ncbi:hypothetical protein M3589_06005 [Heyndrickxia oleronia]|nr:hypothetical protein [Heyndrickxia oleronia]MCM3237282.1 hypothetical protein [Heyndrickxia oleronia]
MLNTNCFSVKENIKISHTDPRYFSPLKPIMYVKIVINLYVTNTKKNRGD